MKLNQKLKAAIAHLAKCQEALASIPEYQAFVETEQKVIEIQQRIQEREQQAIANKKDRKKQAILEAGFECRTGHVDFFYQDTFLAVVEHDAPWKFLIVHSNRPKIGFSYGKEMRDTATYYDIQGEKFPVHWILGYGDTAEESWDSAIARWNRTTKAQTLKDL